MTFSPDVIIFSGYLEGIKIIARHFTVQMIVQEESCINPDIQQFAKDNNVAHHTVSTRENINQLPLTKDESLGISFGFGIIFKNPQIELFTHGIWNIHAGKLPNYRGRHPISYAMLNGDMRLGMTIHQINESIDSGHMVVQGMVDRDEQDTHNSLLGKMMRLLDESLLEEAKSNAEYGKFEPLGEGVYYPSLANGLGDLDPAQHNSDYLWNACKSQYDFGGVMISGKAYKTCRVIENNEFYEGFTLFTCKDGKQVAVQ